MAAEDERSLSADEIALYDRQIRLWGMAAQARVRSAKVVLVNLGSVGTEIAKNVVLSGIGSLTVYDTHRVTPEDLGAQFLVSEADIGKPRVEAAQARLQDLNPRVALSFVTEVVSKDEFYSQFDLVVATELDAREISKLNQITRKFNIPLYVAGSNGIFGYIFVDLIKFDAQDEKLKGPIATQCGTVSRNREIISVQATVDDNKKEYELIETRNTYKPFVLAIELKKLSGKLTRKQSKKISGAVPLTLASFHASINGSSSIKDELPAICEKLGVSPDKVSSEYIEQFIKQQNVEFAPVSAILGGTVAQDVINILGKKQAPLNNFIVLDGISLDMPIYEF